MIELSHKALTGKPLPTTAPERIEWLKQFGLHEHFYVGNAWRSFDGDRSSKLCGTKRCLKLPLQVAKEQQK